jgi:hypothetical protein
MARTEASSANEPEVEFYDAELADAEGNDGLPMPVVPYLARTRYTDRRLRPDSTFVVHLMAIEQQCPQTRMLRRAQPSEATAAYRSVEHHNHTGMSGGRIRRSS